MSHVLLEKIDHLSDTIYKYQKGKHVMATPSNQVLRSDVDFDAGMPLSRTLCRFSTKYGGIGAAFAAIIIQPRRA